MERITSTRNPRLRDVAGLARRRERIRRGEHLAEGPNAVVEALAAGVVVEVFATAAWSTTLRVPAEVTITEVGDAALARLTTATTPQGVVARVATPTPPLATVVAGGFTVVLHDLADPGNAGTIVRTADAAGATGVVLTAGGVDPYGPKAVRAAAGSTYHLPVASDVEVADVLAACRGTGQRVLGLAADGERDVEELAEGPGEVALVLGNEARGLPDALIDALDGTVAVPIHGRAESLNVAAAAAVAFYRVARARTRVP